eukprot:s452_g1.t1
MATDAEDFAPTMVTTLPDDGFVPFGRRRRPAWRSPGESWAPKWRRVAQPSDDFAEFDKVVRGMLNRISTENARFLLPLEPALRGAEAGDCAPWWSARCAALMLNHYIQVIHTSRCARGLAMRSSDNVLPEYLDAVPRLVNSLVAWVSRLLNWYDLCWPTARLMLLATREPRDKSVLPGFALGRLPTDVVKGRILSFLVPPLLPTSASSQDVGVPAALCNCWSDPDGKKDVVAVLAHLLLFTPAAAFPQLSACALAMAEVALSERSICEEKVYLAAAVVVSVSQRLQKSLSGPLLRALDEEDVPPMQLALTSLRQDLACVLRLESMLVMASAEARRNSNLSFFVDSRVLAASEHAKRAQDRAGFFRIFGRRCLGTSAANFSPDKCLLQWEFSDIRCSRNLKQFSTAMATRGIRLPRQLAQVYPLCWAGRAASSSSSAPASSQPGAKDAKLVFANLSKTIHRGFKFDRMFESDDLDPQSLLELDQMALVSMKTQDAPRNIMEKIVRLLRDFGQKKDLQRYGRYMLKRQRSRTSTEIPAVLPSAFLPEGEGEGEGPIAKMRKNPAFKDLFDHAGVRNLDDSAMRRLAMAHMQDRRHVLYQMFWSPEAALTYLAHRYPATWATNLRILYELKRRAPDFQPFRVMDYGAGPTPSLAAVQEIWPGVIEYATAVEPSEHMTQLGKYLMTDLDMPPIHWQRCLYDSVDEPFDLITVSYVQTEVKGQESRDALVKRLWSRPTKGGLLFRVDRGRLLASEDSYFGLRAKWRMLRVLPFYAFLQLTLAGEGVDIVIPAGCRADNYLLGEHAIDACHRDADHDQMLIFTLQSIKRNAPWARRIFLLQDPNCEVVWKTQLRRGKIPQPEKTTWIDRCSLFAHPSPSKKAMVRFRREEALLLEIDAAFPELEVYHQGRSEGISLLESARPHAARKRAQHRPTRHEESEGPLCPTRNLYAVQSVVHHIGDLAERFVFALPGDVVSKPTTVKTFFYGMKPRYPPGKGHALYANRSIVERLDAEVPHTTGDDRRVWVPMTKHVARRIEQRYPKWFSFLRSHRKGRYSSKFGSCGTSDSEKENSSEEAIQGIWWWYLTSHPHSGTRHYGTLFKETRLGANAAEWEFLMNDPAATIVSVEDGLDGLENGVLFRRTSLA